MHHDEREHAYQHSSEDLALSSLSYKEREYIYRNFYRLWILASRRTSPVSYGYFRDQSLTYRQALAEFALLWIDRGRFPRENIYKGRPLIRGCAVFHGVPWPSIMLIVQDTLSKKYARVNRKKGAKNGVIKNWESKWQFPNLAHFNQYPTTEQSPGSKPTRKSARLEARMQSARKISLAKDGSPNEEQAKKAKDVTDNRTEQAPAKRRRQSQHDIADEQVAPAAKVRRI